MEKRWVAWALVLAGLVAGCGWDEREDGALEARERPITYGSLDTTHQAVMFYAVGGAVCTATVVHVSGSQGYALTAAHCLGGPLGTLSMGNDRNVPTNVFSVVETTPHPCYDAGTGQFDYAVLRFSGADSSVPVIPMLAPSEDTLGVGTVLEHVGYGDTEDGPTSHRYHTFNTVTAADRWAFQYSIATTGPNSGDSGGPGLVMVGGTPRVAAVIHARNPSTMEGMDLRVSVVADDFVMAVVNNTAVTWDDGNACTDESISAGQCQAVNNTAACDDGIACTENDACGGGACQPGTPNASLCPAGGPCEVPTCDPQTGCGLETAADWTSCVGGGTGSFACFAGVCTALGSGDDCVSAVTLSLGVPYAGSLAGLHAFRQVPASCVGADRVGPDAFHQIDLGPGQYRARLTPGASATADFVLSQWQGCQPSDACLAGANQGSAGGAETLTPITVTGSETVTLQVLGAAFAGTADEGAYELVVEPLGADGGVDADGGGAPDGGVETDAVAPSDGGGLGDGALAPDGAAQDASVDDTGSHASGCSCRADASGGVGSLPLFLLGIGLLLFRRRRSRIL